MPARKRALDPVFEIDEINNKIRCKECFEADPIKTTWMVRSSHLKHLQESLEHQAHVASNLQRRNEAAASAAAYQSVYNPPSFASLNSTLSHIAPPARPDLFDSDDQMPDLEPFRDDDNDSDDDDNNNEILSNLFHKPIPDAGVEPISQNPNFERERLRREVELLMADAERADILGSDDNDATITNIEEQFAGLDVQSDDEDHVNPFAEANADSDYAPYPNRMFLLLDVMDNLPRLRLSGSQFKIILWLLRECRVKGVPSYDSFRNLQDHLRDKCGNKPTQYTSSLGNIFHVNDVRNSVARDFANPEIVKHMQFYPEETHGPISEIWQAARWKEFAPAERTPMYAQGLRHFYINEIARLSDGRLVMPLAWIMRGGELTADCHLVTVGEDGWDLATNNTSVIPAKLFHQTYNELEKPIPWSAASSATTPNMPNHLRSLANDEELYVVNVPLWCDDVSGNRSKQYNKHINIYMVNANLPGRLLQQEYFVRFVSTSPHASSPEQFSAVMDEIKATHTKPIECYKADTRTRARVILQVPYLPADNPQQSEEASHMGGGANRKCRRSMKGGPHGLTETDEGYHELYTLGQLRTADLIRAHIEAQLKKACYGFSSHVEQMQTDTGTKDKFAQVWIDKLIEKARQMKKEEKQKPVAARKSEDKIAEELFAWLLEQPGDKFNPLLNLESLDPAKDTPVEILHTILLGIVKYLWHDLHTSWTSEQQDLFVIRLQSTDIDGLSVPPIRSAYMMQYRNGLIGKHFKTLMQTMVFHVHGIVNDGQFAIIKSMGALGAVLWSPEINDMDEYIHDLEILIGNILDAFAQIDPSRIINKMKLQVLPHLVDDIRRFGPAIRYSTEIFECFNAIFRLCSVLSNHQVPSRDIANKFASMDRLKHTLSGGFWKEGEEWVDAGSKVRQLLRKDKYIQRYLGWVPSKSPAIAHVQPKPKTRSPAIQWEETETNSKVGEVGRHNFSANTKWRFGVHCISETGDTCVVGSWIFVSLGGRSTAGRIIELLTPDSIQVSEGLVTLEIFNIGDELHPDFDMPVLIREEPSKFCTVKSNDVHFKFSAQHDCRMAICQPTAFRAQMQERQETSRTTKLIAHADDGHYIVNTHGLHNSHLLRKILPRDLIRPKPLHTDRFAHHAEIAVGLRVSQAEKRVRTEAKRKATMEARKKKTNNSDLVVLDNSESNVVARSNGGDEESGSGEEGVMDIEESHPNYSRKRRRGEH